MGGPLGQVLRGHFECAKTSELGAGTGWWELGARDRVFYVICIPKSRYVSNISDQVNLIFNELFGSMTERLKVFMFM